jgi:hypothetical protein
MAVSAEHRPKFLHPFTGNGDVTGDVSILSEKFLRGT